MIKNRIFDLWFIKLIECLVKPIEERYNFSQCKDVLDENIFEQ